MTELPNAAEMRAKLNSAQNHAAQAQIQDLAVKINRAVEQGKSSITVFVFAEGVQDHLKQAGYRVERHAPAYHDPREPNGGGGPYWTVRW